MEYPAKSLKIPLPVLVLHDEENGVCLLIKVQGDDPFHAGNSAAGPWKKVMDDDQVMTALASER
jgi:hypothetical protein